MPAFQLNAYSAALVTDTPQPAVTIVQVSGIGIVVAGRVAVQQLRDACNLSLDGDDARIEVARQHPDPTSEALASDGKAGCQLWPTP